MRLDLKATVDAINELLLAYPELDQDEILRGDMIEAETGAFEFMSRIVRLVVDTKALIAGTALYIDELRARKERLERREQALRALIAKVMETAAIKKAELPEVTLSIRAGVPKVVIVEEKDIPAEFLRTKIEPDKEKIRAALAAADVVPGTMLSNAEPVLAIHIR
jgi:Gp157 protein